MTNNKLDEVFNESFISVEYPELKLGKNNVSSLIKWIGKDYSKVLKFIQNRVNKIDKSNKIAI
ncbi:transposase, partial [Mycoplasma bovis]|nr:transposase [Mycoplasmopsis bovis]